MSTGILIMARAPRPGQVKTRLEPLLGSQGCARLQAELIRHTTRWAAACTQKVWFAFTPADARNEVAGLVHTDPTLFAQRGRDLGERLRHATELAFRTHRGPLAVIGTDAPELGPVHLRFAERDLAGGHDACLVPALDGGYALIALARPIPHAFELPPNSWGGAEVLDLTMTALQNAGCSWTALEPVRDLDTAEDARYVANDPRCPPTITEILKARSAV